MRPKKIKMRVVRQVSFDAGGAGPRGGAGGRARCSGASSGSTVHGECVYACCNAYILYVDMRWLLTRLLLQLIASLRAPQEAYVHVERIYLFAKT